MARSLFHAPARAALTFSLLSSPFLMLGPLTPSAQAQEQGQIAGIITDATGAIVPNINITARNVGTNAIRQVAANSSGLFTITDLQPATYIVEVPPSSGFGGYKVSVVVTVGGKLNLAIKLQTASATTTVEVQAENGSAQINTSTQELSQVIGEEQVSQLPSLTRNPYDFIALSGNISSGDAGSNNLSQNAVTRGVGFGLNGGRTSGTEILLDGVENIYVFADNVGARIPLDSVQEYSVITSNFQPQYGRASGGVVNVSSKSGTNQFHGTVYEFNRLSNYTANTFYLVANGLPKGIYTRNQFGGAVGGPILRDKLFFFGDVEFTRVRSSASAQSLIPTQQFLAQTPASVQSYFSTYGANAPTSNNIVTNAQINPGATALTYPNLPANFPVFQKIAFQVPTDTGGGLPQNTYNVFGRVDYNFSTRTQAFFRYADYHETDIAGGIFGSPYAQYNIGGGNFASAYLLSVAHEFGPSISSATKLSFARDNQPNTYNTALQNTPALAISANAQVGGTNVQFPGFYSSNPSAAGGLPFGGPSDTSQINEDFNVTKGKHAAQFGMQLLYIQENQSFGAYAQAAEVLGQSRTAGLANLETGTLFEFEAAVNTGGKLPCVRNPYTGGLTQTPACSVTLPASAPSFARSDRFKDYAVYAQDNFKATTRLTLDYGLRYEYFGVQHNNNQNLDSNFYFGTGTSLPAQIRSGQVFTAPTSPIGKLWNPQYGTVSPRVGFAVDLFGDGKSSFRGGYGISYERNFGNVTYNLIQNPPAYGVIVENNSAQTPLSVTSQNLGPLAGTGAAVPLPPTSLRNVDENIRTAQTQFWDAAVGRQLGPGTALDIQYTGSRGIHLYDVKNYNGLGSGNTLLGDPYTEPGTGGTTGTPAVTALTRLNPQYSNINNRGSNADSYYEALNVQFNTANFRHTGLSVVANYTFAHSFDDLSTTFSETNNEFGLGYTNPFNPSLDRGPSDFDIRHRFVLAPIYRTPAFDGRKGMLKQLLGGYEVGGIYTVHTGTPFTYYDSTNNASGYNYVRYTPAAGVVSQRTFKSIPNGTAAYQPDYYAIGTLPTSTSFGNPALGGISDWGPYPATMTARNAFRGPGLWGFDAFASKTFPIREHLNVEFRAEGFNILNHHNLFVQEGLNDAGNYGPTGDIITASKGGIQNGNGANDERRFGQFAAKINF